MISKLLAPAVVTCLSLATMAPLTPALAQTAPQRAALASDSSFILTTGSLGLLQVKLGKLAQEKVSEHDEMAGLFADEAKDGRVQSLKQLASSMRPAVQQHQALATQTASAVGADVTA